MSLLKLAHCFLRLQLTVEASFEKIEKKGGGKIYIKDLGEFI